jgi:hypothetical protein
MTLQQIEALTRPPTDGGMRGMGLGAARNILEHLGAQT